jgi:hypothetical protein
MTLPHSILLGDMVSKEDGPGLARILSATDGIYHTSVYLVFMAENHLAEPAI